MDSLTSPYSTPYSSSMTSSRAASEAPRTLRNFGHSGYSDLELGGLDFHHHAVGPTTPARSSSLLLPQYRSTQLDPDIATLLRTATHEDLVEARNPAYMHLDQQLLDTRRDNERLHVRLRDASDNLSKLTDSYETLATSFSVYADQTSSKPREDDTGKSQAVVQTQLNRAQYPNVRYWCKRAWREFTRESKGLTITTIISEDEKGVRAVFHFIQCADGQLIDKETFGRVSQAARGKFSEMATKGVLPSSWDKALWSVRTDFERDMEHAFPVLALCENHWKANEVAKLLFPGFKQNNRSLFETPPAVTVKEEPSVAAATSPATGKRKFAEMDDSAAKSMESPIPLSSHSPSEQRKGKAPAVRMPNRLASTHRHKIPSVLDGSAQSTSRGALQTGMPASGAPNTTPASNASTVGSSFASIAPSTSALQPASSSLGLLAAAASISTVPVPGSTTTGAGATVSVSTSSSSNASPTLSSDLHDISLPVFDTTARSSCTLADSAAVSGATAQKVLADSDVLHDSPSANDSRPTSGSALPTLGSHDPIATSSTATIDTPPSSETAMMADTASMSAPTQHKDGANALSSPLSQTGHVQHHPRPETTQATADQTTAKGASTDSVTPALVIALTNIVIPTLTTQISATSKVSRIYRTSKNISLKGVIGLKWKEVHPQGKTNEFEAYYTELCKDTAALQALAQQIAEAGVSLPTGKRQAKTKSD